MNPDHTQKTRSVWPTSWVKIVPTPRKSWRE